LTNKITYAIMRDRTLKGGWGMKVILLRLVCVTIGITALAIAFMGGRFSMEGAWDSSFLFFATAMVISLGSLLLARADGRKLGKE